MKIVADKQKTNQWHPWGQWYSIIFSSRGTFKTTLKHSSWRWRAASLQMICCHGCHGPCHRSVFWNVSNDYFKSSESLNCFYLQLHIFKYVNYTVCTKGHAEILLNRIKNNEQKLKSKKLVMWNCSTNNTMSYLSHWTTDTFRKREVCIMFNGRQWIWSWGEENEQKMKDVWILLLSLKYQCWCD